MIELVGLAEKPRRRCETLSGGQKRRLDLGLALVGDPDLVFLDEPTTGFDPAARRNAWEMIRSLRELGKTVLLTTHYLDEARAAGRPRRRPARAGGSSRWAHPRELTAIAGETEIRYRANGEDVVLHTTDPTRTLNELTGEALARGEALEALEVRRPTLEDVYLELTATRTAPNERCSRISSGASSCSSGARARRRSSSSSSRSCSSCSSPRSTRHDHEASAHAASWLLAGMLGYGIANTAFAGLAITLVVRRELGVLKRLRATPLPARDVLRGASSSRRCSSSRCRPSR